MMSWYTLWRQTNIHMLEHTHIKADCTLLLPGQNTKRAL
jgi:hypothetical protein